MLSSATSSSTNIVYPGNNWCVVLNVPTGAISAPSDRVGLPDNLMLEFFWWTGFAYLFTKTLVADWEPTNPINYRML